jgi:hypothetical protein
MTCTAAPAWWKTKRDTAIEVAREDAAASSTASTLAVQADTAHAGFPHNVCFKTCDFEREDHSADAGTFDTITW